MKHQLDAILFRFYFCRVTTCFGRKRPSSGVFKTSTAATGTCVIVVGKSSHLLIRAGTIYIYSSFIPSKCSLFHNCNVFGSCIMHILYTGCAKKFKKNNFGAIRLRDGQ